MYHEYDPFVDSSIWMTKRSQTFKQIQGMKVEEFAVAFTVAVTEVSDPAVDLNALRLLIRFARARSMSIFFKF